MMSDVEHCTLSLWERWSFERDPDNRLVDEQRHTSKSTYAQREWKPLLLISTLEKIAFTDFWVVYFWLHRDQGKIMIEKTKIIAGDQCGEFDSCTPAALVRDVSRVQIRRRAALVALSRTSSRDQLYII